MKTKFLPLQELSINQVYNEDKVIYEVPIYQRNYAWGKDEITTLIQDAHDAFIEKKQFYYIGTLVTFHKGDHIYEVIDGQQRLTTIYLVLNAMGANVCNKLTYRARKKANNTIKSISELKIDEKNALKEKLSDEEKDLGIVNGYKFAKEALDNFKVEKDKFKAYFQHNVHLIHYQVPRDIDLNHYFEIMNSRGEQLEKHEIVKARLIEKLKYDTDKQKFNSLWEYCSEMNVYIQQKYRDVNIFGKNYKFFNIFKFDDLPEIEENIGTKTINELIYANDMTNNLKNKDQIDSFQPIIDFSNFLLIVLKLTRIEEKDFDSTKFILDDKELIREFDKVIIDENFVKKFGFNLLMAKYLLDNYIVHHTNEDETKESNPWKLQTWYKDEKNEYLKNLYDDSIIQDKLVQLLSMFEVSFTPRQRKNYLFYCLLYLFHADYKDLSAYYEFVLGLANKYFKDIYLVAEKLNDINTPKPGSFDETILHNNTLDILSLNNNYDFKTIYGDGTSISKGIPLFIFNFIDYKLWEKYTDELRGKATKEGDNTRNEFFNSLGCKDFGLKVFEQFYFSRTRRSLEHYYAQSLATGTDGKLTQEQINCLGNFAMIGSEANSSGSNWSPEAKHSHYLDSSGKINQVSVASLKFMVMMQICKDNQDIRNKGDEWNFNDIKEHQEKILNLLEF